METSKSNTKRIAKNTFFLYSRMILLLLVKLYTSRIILQILGVDDFGIYNLVAGIIVLFTFLESSINSACIRFFSIAIGENNFNKLQLFFSNSVIVFIAIGIIAVIIGESMGLLLFYDKLSIPESRRYAAIATFHIAIMTSFIRSIKVPYNALIISHEKMSFYAYISIFEAILQLGILFLLPLFTIDKLISYSLLLLSISFLILIIYITYCWLYFKESRTLLRFSWPTIKNIFSFSLWSTLSRFATICVDQSFNIFLNIFHGVTLNAAFGITRQVSTSVYSFIQNLFIAFNPQLIKNYANHNWNYLEKIFCMAIKCSIFILLFITCPLLLCIDDVLSLWLNIVPQYTNKFCFFAILALFINTVGGPVWTIVQATGDIKSYQSFIFFIYLSTIPFYYFLFKLEIDPSLLLLIPFVANIFVVAKGLNIIKTHVNFSYISIFNNVFYPIFRVIIIGTLFPSFLALFINNTFNPLLRILILCTISSISFFFSIIILGLNKEERFHVLQIIKSKIKK